MTIEMTFMKEREEHVGEELLESYSRGKLAEHEVAGLEEHVLICETCQEKLAASDSWVISVRREAMRRRGRVWVPWSWSLPRLIPVMAALVLIFAAGVAFRFSHRGALAPVAVVLEATRGAGSAAQVPTLRPLLLQPSLEGLPPLKQYDLEVVDQSGKAVWRTDFAPAAASGVVMPGISPGTYFVRLCDQSRALLREFAMEVRPRH